MNPGTHSKYSNIKRLPSPPPSFISSFQHIPLIRKNYILRLNVFKNNTWLEILHCLRSYFVNWLWWELEITTFLKDTFIFKRKKKGYNHFTVFTVYLLIIQCLRKRIISYLLMLSQNICYFKIYTSDNKIFLKEILNYACRVLILNRFPFFK